MITSVTFKNSTSPNFMGSLFLTLDIQSLCFEKVCFSDRSYKLLNRRNRTAFIMWTEPAHSSTHTLNFLENELNR